MQKGLKKILILIIFSIVLTIFGYFVPAHGSYSCTDTEYQRTILVLPIKFFKNLLSPQNTGIIQNCYSYDSVYRISPSFYIFLGLTILLIIYLIIKYTFLNQKISVITFKLLRIVLFILIFFLIIQGIISLLHNLIAIEMIYG